MEAGLETRERAEDKVGERGARRQGSRGQWIPQKCLHNRKRLITYLWFGRPGSQSLPTALGTALLAGWLAGWGQDASRDGSTYLPQGGTLSASPLHGPLGTG